MRAQTKHPDVLWGYDSIGDNIAIAQAAGRKPRFNAKRLKALQLRDVAAATALVASANDSETFHHAISRAITNAVEAATWRDAGGSRLFGRSHGRDISALLACVHALAVAATLKRGSDLGVIPTIT
jgi:hypothetical protein